MAGQAGAAGCGRPEPGYLDPNPRESTSKLTRTLDGLGRRGRDGHALPRDGPRCVTVDCWGSRHSGAPPPRGRPFPVESPDSTGASRVWAGGTAEGFSHARGSPTRRGDLAPRCTSVACRVPRTERHVPPNISYKPTGRGAPGLGLALGCQVAQAGKGHFASTGPTRGEAPVTVAGLHRRWALHLLSLKPANGCNDAPGRY